MKGQIISHNINGSRGFQGGLSCFINKIDSFASYILNPI